MTVTTLHALTPRRRDRVFARIRRLVCEVEAIDRSIERLGEGMATDRALEEIVELLQAEVRRTRKRPARRRAA